MICTAIVSSAWLYYEWRGVPHSVVWLDDRPFLHSALYMALNFSNCRESLPWSGSVEEVYILKAFSVFGWGFCEREGMSCPHSSLKTTGLRETGRGFLGRSICELNSFLWCCFA